MKVCVGFHDHAKGVVETPEAEIKQRMCGGREREPVVRGVVAAATQGVDRRGLDDADLVDGGEPVSGERTGETVEDYLACGRGGVLSDPGRTVMGAPFSSLAK